MIDVSSFIFLTTSEKFLEKSLTSLVLLVLRISKSNSKDKNILIVGHNPTLHYLVELLTNKPIDRFTTCNLAIISHDGEWISLSSQQCRLRSLIKPKELRN